MNVTALITTYNPNLEQLQQVIRSAAKLFDEVIVVDDCSDCFFPKIKGIKYIRNIRQLGFNDTRARGVAAATGDIIVFLADNQPLDVQQKV
jgi:glycosyltransferase involved in cell wall biosynthesis